MSTSQHFPHNISTVTRCIGYAARLDTTDAWLCLPVVLSARLRAHQRAALAYAALRTLNPDHADMIAELAICGPQGREVRHEKSA